MAFTTNTMRTDTSWVRQRDAGFTAERPRLRPQLRHYVQNQNHQQEALSPAFPDFCILLTFEFELEKQEHRNVGRYAKQSSSRSISYT